MSKLPRGANLRGRGIGRVADERCGRGRSRDYGRRGTVSRCCIGATRRFKHGPPSHRNDFGGRAHGGILRVDVSHELSDRFVRHELHSDLYWHARIRNLGGRAVADAMRPDIEIFVRLRMRSQPCE
jgi:hypothetical protein